jgi:hypothetical protein
MAVDSGPAHGAKAVVASDTTIYSARALYVGTTGNLTIDTMDGQTDVLFKNVPVGWFPVGALRVKAATTAADIVALY